ncbi:MAG: methyltransferase type 11 [Gammaproteobacteria bacterium]|nr:methyltransferase type 11 [Gammaproteobacteria bacterium]
MRKLIAQFALAVFLAGCSQPGPEDAVGTSAPAAVDASIYADAVANSARPAADRARDPGRKPAAVLEFFAIRPGMTVLDLFSGGGYYTEILAYVVGNNGRVIAHSNSAYLDFAGDEFEARYAEDRLGNVDILMAENNELRLEAESLDAILFVLSYHDIYYAAPQRGWPKIDGPALLAELGKGLKPGGIVGIVDHYAQAGSPRETGETLHRIDPAIVIAEMQAAGFELDASSDVLRNEGDDHSKQVFDPDVRGQTDRFLLRFKKPD